MVVRFIYILLGSTRTLARLMSREQRNKLVLRSEYEIFIIFSFLGLVNTILSWKAFTPLSRLTYSVYLWHNIVMKLLFNSFQSPLYVTDQVLVSQHFFLNVVFYIFLSFDPSLLLNRMSCRCTVVLGSES